MTDHVLSFYDSLADYYHLIFEDWDRAIHRQAKILNAILSQELPDKHLKILDCACGVGTQALGLAAMGHHVIGSDLSSAQIARAIREAQKRGLAIKFRVSDMTDLKEISETGFDVVAAFDNALPHLSSSQVTRAVEAMAARLKPGGLFIASIRDYDLLLEQRPAIQEPSFFQSEAERRIVHQVWDWTGPANYTLHLYITIQTNNVWETHHFISEYRCLQREELSDALRSAGFAEAVWLMPAESDYYQPLVLARWP